MLDGRQAAILGGIGVGFWLADVAWIRWVPVLVVDPLGGDAGFLLSVPAAWACARLVRQAASLDRGALVAGATLMVVVAALLHGVAVRWLPGLYGDDHAARLGAAWLLWIYGLILGFALLMSRSAPRAAGVAAAS